MNKESSSDISLNLNTRSKKKASSSQSSVRTTGSLSQVLKNMTSITSFEVPSANQDKHDNFEEESSISRKKVKKSANLSLKRDTDIPSTEIENLNESSVTEAKSTDITDSSSNIPKADDSRKKRGKKYEELTTPFWLELDNIRDKKEKRPNEEGYNPKTLYIPPKEKKALSKFQKKYWEIKTEYFDKILAYKFGHFYFLYYHDALIAHRLLDLKLDIFKNSYSMLIHETNFHKYATKLLDCGQKIAVAEQMESNHTKENDMTRREVCRILTKGTYIDFTDAGYTPRFCLCLYEKNLFYGIVFFDTTTHEIFIGEFKDSLYKETLKTLLTRLKPLEIVYINENLSQDTVNLCKNLSSKPSLNSLYLKEENNQITDILNKIDKYFTEDNVGWPESLEAIRTMIGGRLEDKEDLNIPEINDNKEEGIPFYHTIKSISICLQFLEDIMLANSVFKMGNFIIYDVKVEKKSNLYLDSKALESLEIFDVRYQLPKNATSVGSLFHYMDKTVTGFGKRMFKRWMACPLFDLEKINERLDAVEDLATHNDVLTLFQEMLRRLPDLERMINKIYNLSNKKTMSAYYLEEYAKNRLEDFLSFLNELDGVDEIIKTFQNTSS